MSIALGWTEAAVSTDSIGPSWVKRLWVVFMVAEARESSLHFLNTEGFLKQCFQVWGNYVNLVAQRDSLGSQGSPGAPPSKLLYLLEQRSWLVCLLQLMPSTSSFESQTFSKATLRNKCVPKLQLGSRSHCHFSSQLRTPMCSPSPGPAREGPSGDPVKGWSSCKSIRRDVKAEGSSFDETSLWSSGFLCF